LAPTAVAGCPPLAIDLAREGIGTVLFATGYRPDHSWIDLPVFDRRGRMRHDGGAVIDAPGVFLVGHQMLRRRRSSFISGALADSDEIAGLLHRHLDRITASRPRRARTQPSGTRPTISPSSTSPVGSNPRRR
jgi:putative flavoprotein involved in K+ transport